MEATVLATKTIIASAFDCAVAAAKSILIEQGVEFDESELTSKIKCKFDYIMDDSGVKANILGKAATVDLALNGKLASATRNANWMANQYTVAKLDEDVNKLRMMLSSKGINQNTRVLNSCFTVKRNPVKSSSYIVCNKLIKEKLKRGEVIEVEDESLDKSQSQSEDWQIKYQNLKVKIQNKYSSWVAKTKRVLERMNEMEKVIKSQNETIDLMTKQNVEKDEKIKRRLEQVIETLDWKINSKSIPSELKSEYQNELALIASVDVGDMLTEIECFMCRMVEDNSDAVCMLQCLAKRQGLVLMIE
ncbi:NSP3 protein [Rotavirus A]|uniref:Non-structural protein 3 n=1 Tax=Rotavirus A TaxID=28875 RepID=A0A0P0YKA6_9REOV|nr:NSP3 protein [Rotavirus A]